MWNLKHVELGNLLERCLQRRLLKIAAYGAALECAQLRRRAGPLGVACLAWDVWRAARFAMLCALIASSRHKCGSDSASHDAAGLWIGKSNEDA